MAARRRAAARGQGAVNWPLVMLLALGLDAAFGWPDRLTRRIGHPVIWIGRLIDGLDRRFNREAAGSAPRRRAGALVASAVIGLAALAAFVLALALPPGPVGTCLAALLAVPLLAARSLHAHVAPVAHALAAQDIPAARRVVSHIVGRDPDRLSEPEIARAALESLAENASDAVVAPLLWGAVLGLPGIAAYKAINTLDSMIGHRTPRHADFGRFAARLDDAANWLPARLTALAFAGAGRRPHAAWTVVARDAHRHRSPNAGWPEAALAAILGRRLSGPRAYGARVSDEPWLNGSAPDPDAHDIRRGLALYRRAIWLVAALLALAAGGIAALG